MDSKWKKCCQEVSIICRCAANERLKYPLIRHQVVSLTGLYCVMLMCDYKNKTANCHTFIFYNLIKLNYMIPATITVKIQTLKFNFCVSDCF